MSFRNPLTTSYLKDADAIANIRKALAEFVQFNDADNEHYVSGLHTATWPGALAGRDLQYMSDALQAAGVKCDFVIVFAGEQPEDQLIVRYTFENGLQSGG
jgi:hypothetical protein